MHIKSQVKIKIKSGEPRACPLQDHRIPMGVCSLATSVAKKPADAVNGLSRHILDRQRAACLRYSTVPLTSPVFFCHVSANANPHPIGIRCPRKKGLALPVILALWPLRGSSKAFGYAPLNPWFRFGKILKYTLLFGPFGYESIFVFIFILCKYILT